MKYVRVALAAIVLLLGYGWHQKQVGVLQGEIHARGESIKQLSQLAAKHDIAYREARAKYVAHPTPEGCSLLMLTCDQRDSVKSTQILELNKQIDALTKRGRSSVWSKVPWVLGGVVVGKLILK